MEKLCYGCMRLKSQSPVCEHCGYDERSANSAHQLPPGTVVGGQYILGRVLGQGGFGITYLGWDRVVARPVAIKEYFPTGYAGRDTTVRLQVRSYDTQKSHIFENNKNRFLREAEALAKLWNIPQIVRVLRCFEENNTAYIAMEYVDGVDLKKYVQQKGRKLTARETFSLLQPVMEALSQVHRANLVHRDISPDNIMILPDGSVKLLDFGAARYVENPDAEGALNTSTQAILKHGFAPPEQYQSRGALGPWTDVYAMCATAYYCLSGKVPVESMSRMMDDAQIDWNCVSPLTPKEQAVLQKGMALKPKDRYSSMKQLREALTPPKPAADTKKPPEKNTTVATDIKELHGKWGKKRGAALILSAIAAILAAVIGLAAASEGHHRGPQIQQTRPTEVQTAPAAEGPPAEIPPEEQRRRVYKVGVVFYQYNDNFITTYREALLDHFETLSTDDVTYEILMYDSQIDRDLQINQVETLITQDVDVILLNLVQPSSADEMIERVTSAGIPLILFNREPIGEGQDDYPGIINNPGVCYVGVDPRQAGYIQGRILVNQPDQGDINGDNILTYVMVVGDPGNMEAQWRTQNAGKALYESNVAGVSMIQNAAYWDPSRAREITAAALEQYGYEIDAVLCNNDGMALGAAEAIEAAGRIVGEDIYLLGIDGIEDCQQLVRDGKMTGTVLDDCVSQAHMAADVAVAALRGEVLRDYYRIDFVAVDKSYTDTHGIR